MIKKKFKNLIGDKTMVKITIDHNKCEGADCAECIDVCPMEILILDGDKVVIQNKEECSLCEVCMDVCPNEAVEVEDDD
jgi:NAD-dependent dihydropyrimidine dehydrogenase PreA subunit